MHEIHPILLTFAVVLGVAALTTVLFQRLRLPVIFGYLLAGLVVGPHVPIPLVADAEIAAALAELGVILLMFSLGLEFTIRRLVKVGPSAGVIAVLQSSVMIFLGYGASRLLGWTQLESLYAGAIVAISSTSIIIKVFREQNVKGPVAEVVFGVLIVEDLIAILLLAIITPVSLGRELSLPGLLGTVGRLLAFLAALLAVGLVVVPRAMRFVLRLQRPETTLVACIGLCFGCALLAQSMGYSVALGAFLAGMLVAESGGQESIEPLVEPVRDMFAAIFFVAVGMLIDPALVLKHWSAVLILTLLVVVGKVVAVAISAFLTGRDTRTALQAGLSLAQIGEFSFIIAGVGVATGATGHFLYPVAVAVSAITTLLSPWLIQSAGAISSHVDRHLPRRLQTFVGLYGSWIGSLRERPAHVRRTAGVKRAAGWLLLDTLILAALVLGAALEFGTLTRLFTTRTGLPETVAHVVLLLSACALCAPFVLGMRRLTRTLGQALAAEVFPEPGGGKLDLAAAPRRMMVVTVQLTALLVAGAPLVALTQPFVPPLYTLVVAAGVLLLAGLDFWRSATNLRGHARAGAEVVVAALARQARSPEEGSLPLPEQAYALIPGLGHPRPVRLTADSPCAGRTLRQLQLRARTGATVLAILRADQVLLVPDGHEKLAPGDVLALTGVPEAIEAAESLLAGPGGT